MPTVPCTTSIVFYELAVEGQDLVAMYDCKKPIEPGLDLRVNEVYPDGKITGRYYTATIGEVLGSFIYMGQTLTLIRIENVVPGGG